MILLIRETNEIPDFSFFMHFAPLCIVILNLIVYLQCLKEVMFMLYTACIFYKVC